VTEVVVAAMEAVEVMEIRAAIVKEKIYVNQDGIKKDFNHLKRIFTHRLRHW